MQSLKKWDEKIKMKRAYTSFRDFLRDIASNIPFVLYKIPTGVSRFPPTDRMKVFATLEYEKQRDDLIKKGRDYDFSLDFFANYKKLRDEVGSAATMKDLKAENAEYAEAVRFSKNVYLSFIIILGCENIFYTFYTQDECRNVFNSVMVWDHSEIVYFSSAVLKSYKIFYSRYIVHSHNIWFSSNLIGCSECIFCDNLHNKKYCIENKEYSREDYFAKKEMILREKEKFQEYYNKVNKKAENLASKNISGNFCVYSENVENGYFCYRLQNARNAFFVGHANGRKNVLDTICSDGPGYGDLYGCSNLGGSENCYFSDAFVGSHIYYSYDLLHCSYCIACRGLRNKSYCILNKEYSKEEWYNLADKIFAQMEKDGLLGKTFPASMNPFYFNDTLAFLLGDFTKEEVEKEGFMWRDKEIKVDIPEGAEIVYVNPPVLPDIPLDKGDSQSGAEAGGLLFDYQGFDSNGVWRINPEILKKVVVDGKGNYYKIIKQEYDFLMKYGLPLPEFHWLDRIREGLKSENNFS